ncbi:aspartate aminotransferase family protein [Telluribacter sp.]|jgi:glutamate/tyrosine decarboxylase-like PLP-dependent enzyme|uniref:pyridoxal phosphate-dependent decarboxylase family protein n=1 Tax=Telluribacter sp. TaxID=1978767 RepID=UPI002E12B5EC|nr:aspartate aminotransferase family protein [Telluribacter sp.]
MKPEQLPNSKQPFNSLDMELDLFRKVGYEVIDAIAEYYGTLRERRIISESNSSEIEQVFQEQLPWTGQEPEAIIAEWKERVLPHATHLGSPRYFGFVNGSGTMMSVFADALATSVNMNAGGWKAGPAATEIERRAIAWVAELIGYPIDCGGLFVGGGTIANFSALLTALRNTASYDTTAEGLQSEQRKGLHTLYMSDHEGHISIVKAADMANLGRNAIRRVPSHEDLTMNTIALEKMIEEDLRSGHVPFCVVAQVGSINVGVVDPLEDIARICKARNIWFHADGACGAVGAMLPEKKHLYQGLEKADSVTLDPHKWLYIPYECGCLLVKYPEKLRRTFSIAAPYLQGTLPTDYNGLDYFEFGPHMSRSFNALKVWMSIKHYGREGYQKLLRQNILCAQHLHRLVSASPDFVPMHQPELFIYTFRWVPAEVQQQAATLQLNTYLDKMNQKITDEIMSTGFAFIMTSRIWGQVVIRLSICSHRTTLEDIDMVFERLQQIGRRLYQEEKFPAPAH